MSQLVQCAPFWVVPEENDPRKQFCQWVVIDHRGIAHSPHDYRIADVNNSSTWSNYFSAQQFLETNPHRASRLGFVLTSDDSFCAVILEDPAQFELEAELKEEHRRIGSYFASRQETLTGKTVIWFKESEQTGCGGRLEYPSKLLTFCFSHCCAPVGTVDSAHTAFEDRHKHLLELIPVIDNELGDLQAEAERIEEEKLNAFELEGCRNKREERRQQQRIEIETGIPLPTGHTPAPAPAQPQPTSTAKIRQMLQELELPTLPPALSAAPCWLTPNAREQIPVETQSSEPAAFDLEMPPGLLGDIAEFVYCSAPLPNRCVALAGSIAFLAGVTGRAFNINGTGLNLFIALLAESGIGKEAAQSGISKLSAALRRSRSNPALRLEYRMALQ